MLRAVVLREAVLREVVPRDVVLRLAALRAVRPDADFVAVPRADVLVPRCLAVAVLGRPAERREALVLADRVLPEFAGLRRAVARVVVCTGTEFPPS